MWQGITWRRCFALLQAFLPPTPTTAFLPTSRFSTNFPTCKKAMIWHWSNSDFFGILCENIWSNNKCLSRWIGLISDPKQSIWRESEPLCTCTSWRCWQINYREGREGVDHCIQWLFANNSNTLSNSSSNRFRGWPSSMHWLLEKRVVVKTTIKRFSVDVDQ